MFTIMSSEFLEQAWLKGEKNERSPHIVIMTKRFNDVSKCLKLTLNNLESVYYNLVRKMI